ncbi:hypothetical protein ABIG06_001034 [Bradyrhizobium sp. USDA 326]
MKPPGGRPGGFFFLAGKRATDADATPYHAGELSSVTPIKISQRKRDGCASALTAHFEPQSRRRFSATSCPLQRSPLLFRDLRRCCRCRACPHRSGNRPASHSKPGAGGFRRPIPAPGRMGRSCRSQRIRRPQCVRLVLVAQLLLGGAPKLFLAALGLAGLLPQAVCALSDVLLGRLGQLYLLLEARPHPGGYGGLEAGPCGPAIGGDAGLRSQASIMCKSSCA